MDMMCRKASGGGVASISAVRACKQRTRPDGGSIMTLPRADSSAPFMMLKRCPEVLNAHLHNPADRRENTHIPPLHCSLAAPSALLPCSPAAPCSLAPFCCSYSLAPLLLPGCSPAAPPAHLAPALSPSASPSAPARHIASLPRACCADACGRKGHTALMPVCSNVTRCTDACGPPRGSHCTDACVLHCNPLH